MGSGKTLTEFEKGQIVALHAEEKTIRTIAADIGAISDCCGELPKGP